MSFVAYCFRCEKKVTAHTMLDGNDLLSALRGDTDVEVIHVSDDSGDHRWNLNRGEKDHLLKGIEAGLVP
jgi:hypothetical protein